MSQMSTRLLFLSALTALSSSTDCKDYSPPIVPIPETNNITEVISINFTETVPLNGIWPSDGITLKYSLTDSRKHPNGVYIVFFTILNVDGGGVFNTSDYCYYYDADGFQMHPVYRIELDVSHCITCNNHSCLYCEQQIKAFNFLSELPPISLPPNKWDFTLSHPYSFDVVITPSVITAHLQRCNISFFTEATKEKFDPVLIHFNLSSNCYDRVGFTYKTYITLLSLDLTNELIINIDADHSKSCKLCELITSNYTMYPVINKCTPLQHDDFFTISYEYSFEDKLLYEETNENVMISFGSDSMDVYVPTAIKVVTSHFIKDEVSSSTDYWKSMAINLSIIIPLVCGIGIFCWWSCIKYRRYMNAFVVDKTLVLIIGIAQFIELDKMLDGVRKNVRDLRNLWEKEYAYDVFVCNENELYSTKDDVIQFIDHHKVKLENNRYESVIVHIISHGANKGQTFLSSDLKNIALDGIKHELTESANERGVGQQPLIKIVFNHICRGNDHQRTGKMRGNDNDDVDNEYGHFCEDSNWAVIWGNIAHRTVNDNGMFTKCICDVFGENARKSIKKNFMELITEIGVKLQSLTKAEEICEISHTLRESNIRFERWEKKRRGINDQKQTMPSTLLLSHNVNNNIIEEDVVMMEMVQMENV